MPSEVGATSAWISTSNGRVPSMPANTAVPGWPRSRSDKNSSDGLATSRKPAPVISNTPISSVGPNRFLTARKMRNWCEPSPSNESTASTMCSTTRGPAIWPSLVTWPTRMIAAPDFLAKRISACAEPRTCVTVPGADSTVLGPHGLDRIDDDQARRLAFRQGRDDVLDRRFRRQFDGGVTQSETLGAQAHLRHRFLAGDIDRPMTGARERGGGLDQQSRFADAGIAADQQDRAAHKAAAGDAVEFGNAGGQARGVMGLAGKRLEREQAAFARLATRPCRTLGAFLAERVPFSAGLALALPAAEGGTAVLADEGQGASGHKNRPKSCHGR